MIISEYQYKRKFNLGNYENEEISLKITLESGDNLQEVHKLTKAKIFHLHTIGQEKQKHTINYDPEKIKWVRTQGQNGEFQRYPAPQQTPEQTPEYQNLIKDLQKNDGKLIHDGVFYKLNLDEKTIIRKKPER